MGATVQGGTGTGFAKQSGLGEALPSLQVFLGMLLRRLLASGSSCGISAPVESMASGWAGSFRMGFRLDHPGGPGATLGLGGQSFARLSCSFHWGPEKPSSLVSSHFQRGVMAVLGQPRQPQAAFILDLACCLQNGDAGSAFTQALSSVKHLLHVCKPVSQNLVSTKRKTPDIIIRGCGGGRSTDSG